MEENECYLTIGGGGGGGSTSLVVVPDAREKNGGKGVSKSGMGAECAVREKVREKGV